MDAEEHVSLAGGSLGWSVDVLLHGTEDSNIPAAAMRPGVLVFFGVLGLGTACPTVDQGDPPVMPGSCRPDPGVFASEIFPTAIATGNAQSCVQAGGCHRQEDGRSALRLVEDPTAAELQQNYEVVVRFLNCSTPSASPFITKPKTGEDPHGGGDLWTCDGNAEPCTMVEAWVSGS
jgi:hypothetical protein